MSKPEIHSHDIPEFERRSEGNLRRARPELKVLERTFEPSEPEGPRPGRYIALFVLLLSAVAGAAWYRLSLQRNVTGVFPAFQFSEAAPAAVEFPLYGRAWVVHKTKSGDTFAGVSKKFGLDNLDINGAIQSVRGLPPEYSLQKKLQTGRIMKFQFNASGRLSQLVWQPEANREMIIRRAKQGGFVAKVASLRGVVREHVAVGTITSSFAAAASEAGVSYDVVDELVDLFSNRIEFNKDFQKGDRFTVIYRMPVLRDGSPGGDPQILAAALEVKGEHLVAARYVGSDGKPRYFDEKGNLLGNSFLRYPLKFSRISSYFSEARFHPVLKFTRPHNGIDFAAPTGTPVRTVADGFVIFSGAKGGNGNMVKIRHNTRYSTAYLHLSSIAKGIKNGARVQRGQVIGAVGMTGLATGPHLHFSFYDGDNYINPLKVNLPMLDSLDPGTNMDANYLKRVIFTLDHYQKVTLSKFYSGEE